jgi:tetratricopeptide (TPR) repeat protein
MFDRVVQPIAFRSNQIKIVAVILALVTIVVYSSLLKNGFIYYDDETYITANKYIQKGLTLTNVKWAFTSVGYASNWHPLTWVSHLVDISLFGYNPAGHHFTNLFFHILATLLLFGFLCRTTGLLWPSTIVAALFALHPLHVESVAWAAERKDVLSAVFCFAAIWAYAYYSQRPNLKRYLLVFFLFASGLMAKSMLVTLPILFFLLDYWPLHRITLLHKFPGRLITEKLPLFILSIAASILTLLAQRDAIGTFQQFSLLTRISNALISYCVYLGQMFWPKNLSLFYSYPQPQPLFSAFCALLLAMITLVAILLYKKRRFLITGWLWFLVSLIPVIGIIQVGSQAHADRYTYIPLIGIFITIAWGLHTIAEKMTRFNKLLLNGVLLVVFIVLAIQTRVQIGYWRDGITLFTHSLTVAKGDLNENAYYNYGNLLSQAGRTDEAIAYYLKALEKNPTHAKAHNNLGLLLSKTGRLNEAIIHYRKSLEAYSNPEAHINLGVLLSQSGKSEEALFHYQKALELYPNNAEAHINCGSLLERMGRTDEAIVHFQKALVINPNLAEAHYNLGNLFANTGRSGEAIDHYRRALELNPTVEEYINLGVALTQSGRIDEAIAEYQKTLKLYPNHVGAHINLGNLLGQIGRTDEAITHFQSALKLNPTDIDAHYNLGFLLANIGRINEAITHYQKVLDLNPSSVDAQYNISFLLEKMGRTAEAKVHYKKALELNPNLAQNPH